jgi:hypothetical protein
VPRLEDGRAECKRFVVGLVVPSRDCWCRVLYAMFIWFVGVLQVVGERGEMEAWDDAGLQNVQGG